MATTPTANAAVKHVWVFVLDATGITGLLDSQLNPVDNVQPHFIYIAESTHPELAMDGSKKLYTSPSGVILPQELDEVVENYNPGANPPPPADEPDDEPDDEPCDNVTIDAKPKKKKTKKDPKKVK